MTFRPTAEALAAWLCQDEQLDRCVHGTPYASIIDRQAPAQRSGVLATLNLVADTLKLLPREADTTQRWSAASWAHDCRGWLFLTSTPETRTRLVPLTSLWLDMLVLRLMNRGQPGHRSVWFVLDELASRGAGDSLAPPAVRSQVAVLSSLLSAVLVTKGEKPWPEDSRCR